VKYALKGIRSIGFSHFKSNTNFEKRCYLGIKGIQKKPLKTRFCKVLVMYISDSFAKVIPILKNGFPSPSTTLGKCTEKHDFVKCW